MSIGTIVPSLARTYVPVLVGAFLSWLITAGILPTDFPADAQAGLIVTTTGVVIGCYYTLVRFLERRWPWIGVLLGSTQQPYLYVNPSKDFQVIEGELVEDEGGAHRQ